MQIPTRRVENFVRELVEQCLVSQMERINRGELYKNYAMFGAENPTAAAIFNKTFAYLDDLESLLYSPVSLRFHIGDPEMPNIVGEAKGRAAASKLRVLTRRSDTDTMVSEAVFWSLVRGKTFIKQMWSGGTFYPTLVMPKSMGVMHENHPALDQNMEAFVYSVWITPYQFARLVQKNPDRAKLMQKAKNYTQLGRNGVTEAGSNKQIITGGLYPFQAAGSANPNTSRGIVDWLGSPSPVVDAKVAASTMRMDELWVWDDARHDWATFQQIGDDMLIWGKDFIANLLSHNADNPGDPVEHLKGKHPFVEFCPNRLPEYFWGRSEIVNVALLQEAINSRINGTNKLLRMQEDPPKKFVGGTGVNQNALARFNKPGGYWVDQNPNAKVDAMAPVIPEALWGSLHEYERMFDEMGGLPPIAKGHGEAGVRSAGHAETLVRMFSPRFKDRALLVERDVESLGGIMLDLSRVHVGNKLIAWVPKEQAGVEGIDANPLLIPPAEGLVAVPFLFNDLDDEVSLTVELALEFAGLRGRGQGPGVRFAEDRRHGHLNRHRAPRRARSGRADRRHHAPPDRHRQGEAAGGRATAARSRDEAREVIRRRTG